MYTVYTSQLETSPGNRDNFSHMNRTKLFGESKYLLANRDNFFPYEQALTNHASLGWNKSHFMAPKSSVSHFTRTDINRSRNTTISHSLTGYKKLSNRV